MEYTQLGHSDLSVSRICMGFGDPANEQHSWIAGESQTRKIIRYALEKMSAIYSTNNI